MFTRPLVVLFWISLAAAAHAQVPAGTAVPDSSGTPDSSGAAPVLLPTPSIGSLTRGTGKISGLLLDSATRQPVPYATIALINPLTGKPIDGTTADDRGSFTLTKVAAGTFRLRVSFLGYRDKTLGNVTVGQGAEINVGIIRLSADVRTLNEVDVTAQRALIEEKVDRMIYNADKDLTARGGDAADVLRKVPMLTVDLDGNVSLRGSQNIRVLINNKPSTIVAGSVADALKQIPADMIKTVEVITSPSARYDAEGSAGIINIVTKKNTLQGLTLDVDGGLGNRGGNLGLNGNYRTGKMGISLGGRGRAFFNPARTTLEQTSLLGGISTRSTQVGESYDRGVFGNYTLGFDYDLAKNQSITAGVRYGVRNFLRQQDLTTNVFENGLLSRTSGRDVDNKNLSGSVDVNVDYLRTFKPRQEWSISTLYSRNNLTNNVNADLFSGTDLLTGRQLNLNNSNNQEFTIQTDYQTPIGQNQPGAGSMLEFGAKGIFRKVLSDYSYQIGNETGGFIFDPNRPAGALDYNQNIGAGYVSYTYSTKSRYTFKLGTRYEHTTITADTRESGAINLPAYSNFVPSLNVSKALKGTTTLKAAYNRRIQRPGLQQLNPNVNLANPLDITIGNPYLSPELTDNVEIGISTTVKKTYLSATLFARQTDNAITQVRQPSDTLAGGIVTTYQNIGRERAYGANLFGNVAITPKWSIGGGIDLYYTRLQGLAPGLGGTSVAVSNSGVVISGRLNTQLQLPNGWGVQAFGGTRGNQVQLQGSQGGFYMYNLGVKKDFANKRGSLGLAAENFLTNMRVRTELTSPQFTQISQLELFNRGVRLTFNYKIGKMSFDQQPRRKKKSVTNDDVKAGDGGQQ